MRPTEKHFLDTYDLVTKIDKKVIADWLLTQGYFPEQYVLPPCFKVIKNELNATEHFKVKKKKTKPPIFSFTPLKSEYISVSHPKTQLTDRIFSIIHPVLYHDIIWHLHDNWDFVIKHLFNLKNQIASYSFPIPVSKKSIGKLVKLRAGRMIYEWIEMAEKDLVSEAFKFKYIVRTDIKTFYPAVYTHSIAWALHSKIKARRTPITFSLLGSKLDKLFQNANDTCTNGLPIGPVISDFVAELLLTTIDKETSLVLKKKKINFVGVRFKDDYRFLCESKGDAEVVIKCLQQRMKYYNLYLNDSKTEIKELPEGLFRPWSVEYSKISLKKKWSISPKLFENTLIMVLEIDKRYPDTGIIDKFLSELITKKSTIKIKAKGGNLYKIYSLLLMLKERRPKAFPQILAIIELLLLESKSDIDFTNHIHSSLSEMLHNKYFKDYGNNLYDLIWLTYLVKSNDYFPIRWPTKLLHPYLKSIQSNSQQFFNDTKDISLFKKIEAPGKNPLLAEHLSVFHKL